MNASHDHTVFREEVEQRWGTQAYADSDAWWRSMSENDKAAWKTASEQLMQKWQAAASDGEDPRGAVGQDLAAQQVAWLSSIPGTPGYGQGGATNEYVLGLGEMYVADERFAANNGGVTGATFVRDALRAFIATR